MIQIGDVKTAYSVKLLPCKTEPELGFLGPTLKAGCSQACSPSAEKTETEGYLEPDGPPIL